MGDLITELSEDGGRREQLVFSNSCSPLNDSETCSEGLTKEDVQEHQCFCTNVTVNSKKTSRRHQF